MPHDILLLLIRGNLLSGLVSSSSFAAKYVLWEGFLHEINLPSWA